ncbi:MAG: hemerythrin domain-containing protein [Myxococcales bacterium]
MARALLFNQGVTTRPRSIRQQLLFEHEVLRALLGRVADAAERTLRGEPAVQDLRDAARSLQAVLEAHVQQEEQALAPLFARRSPQWLQDFRADHRRALETLRRLRTRPGDKAAGAAQRLVPHLLAAIEREGRDLLAPEHWRWLSARHAAATSPAA